MPVWTGAEYVKHVLLVGESQLERHYKHHESNLMCRSQLFFFLLMPVVGLPPEVKCRR